MKNCFYSLLIAFCSMAVAFNASAVETLDESQYLMSPKGVAAVKITLDNGKKIDDIKRDEKSVPAKKLTATMVISNAHGSTYDKDELYNGKIEIKGRGNTSWGLPKKPYSVDLIDDAGKDNPSKLLGMPADEEWVLVAFWTDRSCMRHPLAYFLGGMMDGISYSPRTRFVELYINDEYRGLYMLAEKIKRGSNRIDIKKLDETKENGISGGYILECSPEDRVDDDEKHTYFKTSQGINFIFKYPKPKNATAEQVEWIKNYLNQFEDRLWAHDYTEETGYRKYADPDGFLDWIILHDLSKGVDNLFHASVFVQKDRNGLLKMSAPWDFDLSFGNIDNTGTQKYEHELWIQKAGWWHQLWKDPKFAKDICARYDELMPLFNQIPAIIAANYNQLESCGAIQRESERWPQILREAKDAEGKAGPETYKGHARWLAEWIESRKSWLYMNYAPTEAENCERLKSYRPVVRVYDPDACEQGKTCEVRTTPGFEGYLWDGTNRTDNPIFTINDDNEHFVQIIDKHGCISLPSLPIKRGEAYKEAFGQSKTTGINNVVSDNSDDASKLFFFVNAISCDLRICYPAAQATTILVAVCDLSGKTVFTTTVNAELGLGIYNVALNNLGSGIYVVTCSADGQTVSKKVVIR